MPFDVPSFLLGKQSGGGGGVTVESKSISANGTYTAPTGKAYSPVTVNVANSYTAGDEGKVVSSGALVSQTAHAEVTQNGTIDTTLNNSVVVNVSGGGGGVEAKQVNFIDYDGTILHSYTKAEFNQLDSLPANPTHTGLTSQGWNWSLAQITAQLTAMPDGPVWVGQHYITTSGATEIDIDLPEGSLSPWLKIAPNGTVTIDWGDGSATDTCTGTSLSTNKYTNHTYAAAGSYTIKLTVSGTDTFAFYNGTAAGVLSITDSTASSREYSATIKAIRIGSGMTSIGSYAFNYCYSLASVTIPSSVTSIGSNAFQNCYTLASVVIPFGLTYIDAAMFQNCYSMTFVAIPSSVTSIRTNVFSNCYSLTSVTIPSSVTEIGNSTFYYCPILSSVVVPSSVTSIGSGAFQYCYALTSVNIPSGVTVINASLFTSSFSLPSIAIPSGVTSIDNNAFQNCYTLTSVTIPSDVTSIGTSAFSSLYSAKALHFKPETPPNVPNSNAFSNLPTACIIYVPTGKLSAYTSASNYPSSLTYTYVEE